jgi:diadenosine tetraphosphate (Ap4A) HIT family hydrolase
MIKLFSLERLMEKSGENRMEVRKIFLFMFTLCFLIGNRAYSEEQACKFCNEGEGIVKKHTNLYGDVARETNIVLKTDNFFVAIDNFPVFEDHLLIIPKKHYLSFSMIEDSLAQELDDIIYSLKDLIGADTFGLFEHGSNMVDGQQKLCGNSIYHAHLHLIPNLNISRKELSDLLSLKKEGALISFKNHSDISRYIQSRRPGQNFLAFLKGLPTHGPYLFCYFSDESRESFCIPDCDLEAGAPSQFFRKVFAEYFQKNQSNVFWDWKNSDSLENSKNFRTQVILHSLQKFKDQNDEVFTKSVQTNKNLTQDKIMHYCLFCNPPQKRVLIDGKLAYAFIDDYPVTDHHCLVIAKRHFGSFFDVTDEELREIFSLLRQCKDEIIKKDPTVEGFNIGINDGKVSGQSIFHLHIHLIPRRSGDIENPRGGIRGIFPEKRNY